MVGAVGAGTAQCERARLRTGGLSERPKETVLKTVGAGNLVLVGSNPTPSAAVVKVQVGNPRSQGQGAARVRAGQLRTEPDLVQGRDERAKRRRDRLAITNLGSGP